MATLSKPCVAMFKNLLFLHKFTQGWQLMSQPGIRYFVIIPLLVTALLMNNAFGGYAPAWWE
ncbi:MAG: hypothetical protein ACSLEL_00700 [Candidatus Malihini olakiniferum]